jgi:hypothetical protein
MLPVSYIISTVRNVTPVCQHTQRIGIGFDLATGDVLRVALDEQHARDMCDLLNAYINSRAGSHSLGSALSPSEPMSVPSEGVNT